MTERKDAGAKPAEKGAKPIEKKESAPKRVDEKPPKKDEPMRVLARRAVQIAEAGGASMGSAVTAPQAEVVAKTLGKAPLAPFAPATVEQLLAYAQGGKGTGRTDMPDDAKAKLRDFCRDTGSRRIWPRKVAALALAIHEQQTGKSVAPTPEGVKA